MDEEELVERCLKGEEEAMDLLVRTHWDHVYSHCLKMVHDKQLAQDLSQETFLRVFEHLPSFKSHSRLSTWIWRIAHNHCLNYLKRHHQKELPLFEEILPTKEVEREEDFWQRIEVALKILNEKHRIIFELYDLQHIPQKEIAARLHIPHGTVRSRLHYARAQLRKHFSQKSI